MSKNLADLRISYPIGSFDKDSADPDPIKQFQLWLQDAIGAKQIEPNAMALATVNKDALPSVRMVLLKGLEDGKFIFYSNYESRKASDIEANAHVALMFWWDKLSRQVRVEGTIEKVDPKTSDIYFQQRPRGSRIGAWSSPQSRIIKDRHIIEENVEKYQSEYADKEDIPRPDYWGGYGVTPLKMEFWQGRPSRLHDRLLYTKNDQHSWEIVRLAP